MPITDRLCNNCQKRKAIDEYELCNSGKNRRGTCKECRSEYGRAYRQRPEWKQQSISNARKYRYGISEEQYQKMLEEQGGKCAICKREETCLNADGTTKNLSVDHDHNCCSGEKSSCGKCIRALLCAGCNRGIGYMRDDVDILLDAATYLMSFNNVLAGGDYHTDY